MRFWVRGAIFAVVALFFLGGVALFCKKKRNFGCVNCSRATILADPGTTSMLLMGERKICWCSQRTVRKWTRNDERYTTQNYDRVGRLLLDRYGML